MISQFQSFEKTLRDFRHALQGNSSPHVDRKEIVAHATLSALSHHWPSQANDELCALLAATAIIKDVEHSRWAVQRRIAITKWQRFFETEA